MGRTAKHLSEFGALLKSLCLEKGKRPEQVMAQIGIPSTAHFWYAVQPHRNGSKRGLLDAQQIMRIATILDCDEKTEFDLVLLGALEYAPGFVADYIHLLQDEVVRLAKKAEERPAEYSINEDLVCVRTSPRSSTRRKNH